MEDFLQIEKAWKQDEKSYQKLGKLVKAKLEKEIFSNEKYAEVTFRTKELISLLKKLRKRSDLTYDTLTDKLGVRVICNYKQDVLDIHPLINELFKIEKFEDKAEKLSHEVFAYTSYHYDLTFPSCSEIELRGLMFELQLRTINQHAWACTAHELSYKQDIELPKQFKRKVHRLCALYEIADDELHLVNRYILDHDDFPIFQMLRTLEGKYYKLSHLSYDREMSFDSLAKVFKFLSKEETLDFTEKFDQWAELNSERITNIFSDYKNSLYKGYLILQPETLLFWFLLDKHFYTIKDNWNLFFNDQDFDHIKAAWAVIE